jgi:hypothetical protein
MHKKPFKNLIVVGFWGHPDMRRIKPAEDLLYERHYIQLLLDVDTKQTIPIQEYANNNTGYYRYWHIDPVSANLSGVFSGCGISPDSTAVYISTPEHYQGYCVRQALAIGCGVVACEKPRATNPGDAAILFGGANHNLYAVDQYLFKKQMQAALVSVTEKELRDAQGFEFVFFEKGTVSDHDIDSVIVELGWHGFSCISALFRSVGFVEEFCITDVTTATYCDIGGAAESQKPTAAKIDGYIAFNGYVIPFVIRVGKGLRRASRLLVIWRDWHNPQRVIRFNEGAWKAHYRMLKKLIVSESPDMGLDLNATENIFRACCESQQKAHHEGNYRIRTMPVFLEGGFLTNL